MSRTHLLPESRALDVDPNYTRATEAAQAAGITYRQLDTWIRNHWINAAGGTGSGYVRHLHHTEATVLTHMANLVRRGLTPPPGRTRSPRPRHPRPSPARPLRPHHLHTRHRHPPEAGAHTMTTTANIAAKGTNGTGITEELAETLHHNLGRKVVAVVELVAETRSEKRNGDEKVVLSILTVEPAPNGLTEDHLRELARSFHYERQLAADGPTLTGDEGPEPKVSDVMAAGARYRPHPYLASTLSTDDTPVCDVCGHHEDTPVHADRTDRDRLVGDPFDVPEGDPDGDPGDDQDGDLQDPDANPEDPDGPTAA